MPGRTGKEKCWCGQVKNRTVIQCNACTKWSHYLCSGLSLKDIDRAVNDDPKSPGLFLCKSCCEATDTNDIESGLLEAYPSGTVYRFSAVMHAIMNLDSSAILSSLSPKSAGSVDSLHAKIERIEESQRKISSVVEQLCITPASLPPSKPTFLDIAKRQLASNAPNSQHPEPQLPVAARPAPRLVDPEQSIIAEKIEDPGKYSNTLNLKRAIDQLDPSITPHVSTAKVTASGRILFEATSREKRDIILTKLQALTSPLFGADATLREMASSARRTPTAIIIRDMPFDYDLDSVKAEIKLEYDSVGEVISLAKRDSARKFRSLKVTLSDQNDYNSILQHGVHVGLSFYRAQPWVDAPRRCYKCQRFNHVASACQSAPRCVNCGEDHAPDKTCAKPSKCANCHQNHRANHNKCSIRQALVYDRMNSVISGDLSTHGNR